MKKNAVFVLPKKKIYFNFMIGFDKKNFNFLEFFFKKVFKNSGFLCFFFIAKNDLCTAQKITKNSN